MGSIIYIGYIARDNIFMKIMIPMLKLYTNYGFHELFFNEREQL